MRTLLVALFLAGTPAFAQDTAFLVGRVTDETGGVLAGATIEVTNAGGFKKSTRSDRNGLYTMAGLVPGTYVVSATLPRFSPYANGAVEVKPGTETVLDIPLAISLEDHVVVESEGTGLSVDPNDSAGTIVLKGEDLDALPDDPDELAEYLQALAGPSAGPNGGQFYIDGFTGTLPPKASIREIRVGGNPFSSEFDRMGFGGRIEILTRAGTDTMRGDVSFNFNDEMLNARNPFAPDRPPYQRRDWRANFSGPIVPQKASFSLSAERSDVSENDIVNATILDPSLAVIPFADVLVAGSTRTEANARVELALSSSHTLAARYEYDQNDRLNAGVGDFSLPSRGYDTTNREHVLQLTETAVLRGSVINELRFQFRRDERRQDGDNTIPSLSVPDAFLGGGPQIGESFNHVNNWELGDTTSWVVKRHSFRAGVRVRGVDVEDVSRNNFGGSVTFAGGDPAPVLDANNEIVLDAQGQPVLETISNIERYRRTLLFSGMGLDPAEIRRRGGGATQFRITGGNPAATVDQWDLGLFLQDDWRLSTSLTLSMGLRYENQTNIESPLNLAPRLGFAWAPGAAAKQGPPKTVLRGGVGIFYDRFGQGFTLEADRADGITQQQFLVTDPAVLDTLRYNYDRVTFVPSADTLTAFAVPLSVRVIAPDVEAPYRYQGAISLERQLPAGLRGTLAFLGSLTRRELRSRNINAPLPGSGERPLGNDETVYQYESTGRASQSQILLSLNRTGRGVSVFAHYSMTWAYNDTDGAFTFPADQYDLSNEWGRAAFAPRHNLFVGGNIVVPGGIRVGPMMVISSGRPFNITTGRDDNGDTLFTDRPAFATDPNKPGVVATQWGLLDPNPEPGQKRIPRNLGLGPGTVNFNLSLSKTIGFGGKPATPTGPEEGPRGPVMVGGGPGGPGGPGGGPGGGRGGGGGGRFGGDAGRAAGRYNLSLSLRVNNVLNHTNKRPPVGNLSSPLFGQSTGTFGFGGARRITLNVGLRF